MDIQVIASGSKGNCYRIDDGRTPLLMECGIGFRNLQEALDFGVRNIKGCLVTHEHKDHCRAVKELLRSGVKCYMSKGTAYALGNEISRFKYNVITVEAEKQFTIGTWTIMPLETQHDAAEPLGFLLQSGKEKLLYASDTYYLQYTFKGITHLMIECNYSEEILGQNVEDGKVSRSLKKRLYSSHFNLRRVKEFIQANNWDKLEEVYLIHLSESNSDEEQFKREIAELTGVPVYVA